MSEAAAKLPETMPETAKVNHELVRLLEAALSDAKAGRVVAGGVCIVLGPSNFAAFSSMSVFPAEVIAGAAVLTSDVIAKLRQPRASSIVRPGQVNGNRMGGG